MFIFKKIKDKIGGNRMFFISICILFIIVGIFDPDKFLLISKYFFHNLKSLIPVLLLVYIIIFIFSIIISNKKITNYLKTGHYFKKMFLSIIAGIISSGPIYLRFGFLKELHNSGLTLGHIAGFSYARAIKIPLIPMMIVYFDVKFTIIFTILLLVSSFFQCLIVDGLSLETTSFQKFK